MDKFLLRRYALFVVSVSFNTLGISLITKALLGTTPITSVNYVLSMFTPLTMGQWTIIVNLLFVAFEALLMKREDFRNDRRIFWLQVPVSLCFGMFIDWFMALLYWLEPQAYAWQLVCLAVGCFVLAFGIALEVKANVAMVSGEYFVRVISRRYHTDFGYTKLGFDLSQVMIAAVFSLVFMSGIRGIREGTVVAALAVGPIVHWVTPFLRFIEPWIGEKAAAAVPVAGKGVVVTIAREYGSGGHLLGERLAKELGIKLYDREFISLAARQSGMDESYILKNEQSLPSFWMKCIRNYNTTLERSLSPDDILFLAESKIIQDVSKESCVIVGRLADFILKDRPDVIRLFCCTDMESACRRCTQEYGVKPENAEAEIRRINRKRSAHYEFYTGGRWGDPHRYDLMVNVDKVGLDMACKLAEQLYRAAGKKPAPGVPDGPAAAGA